MNFIEDPEDIGMTYHIGDLSDLPDGIWLIKNEDGHRTYKSLARMLSKIEDPSELISNVSIQTLDDKIGSYLLKLSDEKSEEYADAKDILGGYLAGPVQIGNISFFDLAQLILYKIGKEIGKEKNIRTRMIW